MINVVDRTREMIILVARTWRNSLIYSLFKLVCLGFSKEYSAQLIPIRMFSTHPRSISCNKTSLLAVHADRAFYSTFFNHRNDVNVRTYSSLDAFIKDIFNTKLFVEQKKEVTDCKMTRKHCKTFQYFNEFTN